MKIYLREAIDKKLLGDVVFAVGIFKSQVEFVVSIEHIEAGIGLHPGASFSTTSPINVNFDVFRQLFGVIQPAISSATIADKPGNGLCFVGRNISALFKASNILVIILPAK